MYQNSVRNPFSEPLLCCERSPEVRRKSFHRCSAVPYAPSLVAHQLALRWSSTNFATGSRLEVGQARPSIYSIRMASERYPKHKLSQNMIHLGQPVLDTGFCLEDHGNYFGTVRCIGTGIYQSSSFGIFLMTLSLQEEQAQLTYVHSF